MSKNHQRILQLHSLLSKLLDSFSFQLCVNRRDENCLSLLEILIWRKRKDIDDAEFMELYRSWLESKSVFDLQTCKQFEIYPKHQLIGNDLVQQNFMNVGQLNKALQILNEAYNKFYYEKKPNSTAQIQQAERIFSYLDTSGYIHLRLSSLFFFTGATIILERYTMPINYQAFKVHMNDLRKQLSEVNGMVSLRGFKNFLLNLNSVKRANYFQHLMNIFSEIQHVIGGEKNCLPNLFDDVFQKWRGFPRFNSSENKKNLQIYRRVFQQNQKVFFDQGATIQYFLEKYGDQFVKCFQIESTLLRQFNVLLKQSLNKYIEYFSKVSQKVNNKHEKVNNNSTMMTHRKRQQLPQMRLAHKATSMKDRTPTKSHKLIQTKNTTRTPTKASNIESKIRKQFGSAEKSRDRTINNRTLTPTRPITPTKSSSRQSGVLHHSQAYTGSQKSAIKVGVEKDSFYNKMTFFRNKRVQSYQVVMKRLRGK